MYACRKGGTVASLGIQKAAPLRSRRERKKLETRATILAAARKCFSRKSVNDTRLEEIADLADVSRGTLFNYFPSKTDLVVAILAENNQIFVEMIRSINGKYSSLAERLEHIFVDSGQRLIEAAVLTRRLLEPSEQRWQMAVNDSKSYEALLEVLEQTLLTAADQVRTDVPPRQLCEIALSIYTGLVGQWRADETYPVIDRLRAAAFLFMDMAGAGPQQKR